MPIILVATRDAYMLPSATRPPSACYQGPGSKQIVEQQSTENVRSLMIPLRFKHGIGKLIKLHTYLLQRPKTTILTAGIKI